jgi:hypothetical protein
LQEGKDAGMKKYPLVWFYILAFGIAWLGWVPVALGSRGLAPIGFPFLLVLPAIAPALAAVLVTLFHLSLNTFGAVIAGVSVTALSILECLAAVVLIVVFGSANLSHRARVKVD